MSYQDNIRHRAVIQLGNVKKRAKEKDLRFELSVSWYLEQFEKPCAISGLPFDLTAEGRDWSPSVDRIDPTQGYTQSNCRLVLNCINMFKGTLSDDDIYYISKKIVNKYRL